jgi:hypothetical protein
MLRHHLGWRVLVGAAVCSLTSGASAFSFGSGTCVAAADSSFMSWKTHHPGDSGGFVLDASQPDYIPGETLGVRLRHASEAFIGFLIYAEASLGGARHGLFTPVTGSTLSGALPQECAHAGHTITHDLSVVPVQEHARATLSLAWTAPDPDASDLIFRALVLRAAPLSQSGTDFYEVSLTLPLRVDGIFRSGMEPVP